MAPAARTQGIIRYAGRDVAAGLVGIDPQREPKVSATLAKHMSEGTPAALYRAANAVILGDRLAKRIGARVGSNLTVQGNLKVQRGAVLISAAGRAIPAPPAWTTQQAPATAACPAT